MAAIWRSRAVSSCAEDAQGKLGGPGVAAELVGRADVVLDVHGGALGFEKEFARATDAEAVVGGLGGLADLDGILMNDVLVGLGVALLVVDVPSKGLEERVKKFAAQLGFVVLGGFVGVAIALEPLDQLDDLLWWLRHLEGQFLGNAMRNSRILSERHKCPGSRRCQIHVRRHRARPCLLRLTGLVHCG